MLCNIVVRVRDLDECRYFYREIVGLGEPECDSGNFSVFRLTDDCALFLELNKAPFWEHASSAVSWSVECANFDILKAVLEKHSALHGTESLFMGRRRQAVCDPEGNLFYIVSK